jgi:hypothetical protein
MPNRLREKYLRESLEAIIRYAAADGAMRYRSDSPPEGGLRITFDFEDAEQYQTILSAVMAEDPELRD